MGCTRLIVIALLIVGCDGSPSREKFPGGHGQTTDSTQAQTQKAVLGGFDPLNNKLPSATGGPMAGGGSNDLDAKPEESIRGSITLDKDVVLKEGMFLFISAKRPEGGPPLAARREFGVEFPFEFTLSGKNAMMAGTPFEGEIEVTARLDQDGDPTSHQKGDWTGFLKTKVGDQKIAIVIKDPVTN